MHVAGSCGRGCNSTWGQYTCALHLQYKCTNVHVSGVCVLGWDGFVAVGKIVLGSGWYEVTGVA